LQPPIERLCEDDFVHMSSVIECSRNRPCGRIEVASIAGRWGRPRGGSSKPDSALRRPPQTRGCLQPHHFCPAV
jgi:hypothetical protein